MLEARGASPARRSACTTRGSPGRSARISRWASRLSEREHRIADPGRPADDFDDMREQIVYKMAIMLSNGRWARL
jgi:hypothetical protein